MSNHSFDIHIATEYKSVDIAILAWHFHYWIMKNKRLGKNHHDGHTWTYQTNLEIASAFPYWSIYQIERLIKKAVELKILIKGNYNKSQFDRTVWYAFENEEKFGISRFHEMESAESGNGTREIAEPIPDTLPNTLPNKEREGDKPPPRARAASKKEKPEKKPYRDFVLLTEEEYAKLEKQDGKEKLQWKLDKLNNTIGAKGARGKYKYDSHYFVLKKGGWVDEAFNEQRPSQGIKITSDAEREAENRAWFRERTKDIKIPRFETWYPGPDYVQFKNTDKDTTGSLIYFRDSQFIDLVEREFGNRSYPRKLKT